MNTNQVPNQIPNTAPNAASRQIAGECCPSPKCREDSALCGQSGKLSLLTNMNRSFSEHPCSPQMCSVFGGHDKPYHRDFGLVKKRKRRERSPDTLGDIVGVVYSTIVVKPTGTDVEAVRFATYLKSFALLYVTVQSEWSPDDIDKLLAEGQQLFNESQDQEVQDSRPNIYSDEELRIQRNFIYNDHEFQIELEPSFRSGGDNPEEPQLIIKNLRSLLRAFMRKVKYCLFFTPDWYLLIWKSKGIYFVLDFNGRTTHDFETAPNGGYAMLICLQSLDNVVYLIKHLSGLDETDTFSLREMMVVKFITPEGHASIRDYAERMSEYEVINSDYAYLKSNLHLTLNPNEPLRNRSALPVGIATMIASKIDHPATWDQKTYDKVMCYGVNMCRNCWEPCINLNEPINLDTFPRQLRIGQFVAELQLTPRAYMGNWRCVPKYKNNDFQQMLEKALVQNDFLLFQINNQMYAIWKKNDFIYLMDPYRHHIVGRILIEGEDPKSATIRMFRTVNTLLSVFHQILMESNRSAIFYIHTMKLRNLVDCPLGAPPLVPIDLDVEVKSVNESIEFGEDYTKCLEELGEISDYEEDLVSDIVPFQEPSSSEEAEEMEEEEGGEEGGEGGAETESSDEDDEGASSLRGKGGGINTKQGGGDSFAYASKEGPTGNKSAGGTTGTDIGGQRSIKGVVVVNAKQKQNKKRRNKKMFKKKNTKAKDITVNIQLNHNVDHADTNLDKTDKFVSFKMQPENTKAILTKLNTPKNQSSSGNRQNVQSKDYKLKTIFAKKSSKTTSESPRKIVPRPISPNISANAQPNSMRTNVYDYEEFNPYKCWEKENPSVISDNIQKSSRTVTLGPLTYRRPGYSRVPTKMAVIGSESGTYESISRLLHSGFRHANRVMTMTPWGNYVIFREAYPFTTVFYVFDGCTCNIDYFRHLDLSCGTAGLLQFQKLRDVICYMIDARENHLSKMPLLENNSKNKSVELSS